MKKLLVICIALSVLFLLVAVVAADDMGKAQTVNGWVSDSKCGAKGANAGAAACTKKCIDGGASAVVVTDGDNKVLAVDNADALKGHEGHHVAKPSRQPSKGWRGHTYVERVSSSFASAQTYSAPDFTIVGCIVL